MPVPDLVEKRDKDLETGREGRPVFTEPFNDNGSSLRNYLHHRRDKDEGKQNNAYQNESGA